MSVNVRTHFSETEHKKTTASMLSDIFSRHEDMFAVDGRYETMIVNRIVAASISQHSHRDWSWRYIISVKNGTLKPSAFLCDAIEQHWNLIHGIPRKIAVDPCPIHGKACVLNCVTEKAVPIDARVTAPGAPRKRKPRIAISKLDAASAADSMRNNIDPKIISAIVGRLLEDGLEVEY